MSHFDIALGLESTSVKVLGCLRIQCTRKFVVEKADTDNVECHKEADAPVDGNVNDYTVADSMSIGCKDI